MDVDPGFSKMTFKSIKKKKYIVYPLKIQDNIFWCLSTKVVLIHLALILFVKIKSRCYVQGYMIYAIFTFLKIKAHSYVHLVFFVEVFFYLCIFCAILKTI